MNLKSLLFGSNNPGNKTLNIKKLINSDDINGSIIKLDDFICKLCGYGENLNSLSDPQKIFYYIQNLEKEINNGGFKLFYRNSSGDFAKETYSSLRIIGAYKTASILLKANDQFPDKTVPKNRSERQQAIDQILDTSDEIWKALDQRFLAHEENLNSLNMEFIKKNKDFF